MKHDEICWEFYTGRHFAVPELVPSEERHQQTSLKLNALGGEFLWTPQSRSPVFFSVDRQTKEEDRFLSVLLEEMRCWHRRRLRYSYQ